MRHVMLFITLLILATVQFGGIACAEAPLHIGVATIDITPETGETHDPLAAKAIVHQQGDVSAALVVCDVIVISPGVSESARSIASQRTENDTDRMDGATVTRCGLRWYKNRVLVNHDADGKNRSWQSIPHR